MADHSHPLFPEAKLKERDRWLTINHQICACLDFYAEELTATEIAIMTGLTVKHVSTRLNVMRKKGWVTRSKSRSVCRFNPRIGYRYHIRNYSKLPWGFIDDDEN